MQILSPKKNTQTILCTNVVVRAAADDDDDGIGIVAIIRFASNQHFILQEHHTSLIP